MSDDESPPLMGKYAIYDDRGALLDANADPALLMRPLSKRQFNLMLRLINTTRQEVRDTISAVASDIDAREIALIEFEDAISYNRRHELVSLVAYRLGYSEDAMDAMWRHAMTL